MASFSSSNKKKFDIFISYNWDSKPIVRSLYNKLKNECKLNVWLDDVELDSRNLYEQLIQGINDSVIFLCCITQKYCESDNCVREINFASVSKKPFIVVMLERLNVNELGGVGFIIASLTRFNFYKEINNLDTVWSNEMFSSMLKSIEFNLSNNANISLNSLIVDSLSKKESLGKILSPRISSNKTQQLIQHLDNGNSYEGEIVNGKLNGKGKLVYANGDCYEGEFLNDLMHGKGTFMYKSGNRYEGDWVDGMRSGKGVLNYKDGSKYEGDFLMNQKHGKGVLTLANGDRYEGDFNNDEQTGKGVYHDVEYGDRYVGDFLNGKKHGKGEYYYADGDKYIGEYYDDDKHGKGIFYFVDGEIYDGEWADDKKNGNGTYYLKNGKKVVGKWKNDKKISNS